MAYPVNRTDGTLLVNVADNTIDTSRSVKFIGRKTVGFGEVFNENNVALLENFASTTAPAAPVLGQFWYDKTNSKPMVCVSESPITWRGVSMVNTSRPSSPETGDLYWNTVSGKLEAYNGAAWIEIGPPDPSSVQTVTGTAATSSGTPSATIDVPISESTAVTFEAFVTARDTTTGTDTGMFKLTGAARRAGAAGVAIVGSVSVTTIALEGAASTQPWTATAAATGNNVRITVTGQNSSNTINWGSVANLYKVS